jgi:hypothetical protein
MALGTAKSIGEGWKFSEFPDSVPSLQRIRDRVTEFAYRGLITAAAERQLKADLVSDATLPKFESDVQQFADAGAVLPEARQRLDGDHGRGLAERRQSAGASAPADPSQKPAPPGYDPVLGPPNNS